MLASQPLLNCEILINQNAQVLELSVLLVLEYYCLELVLNVYDNFVLKEDILVNGWRYQHKVKPLFKFFKILMIMKKSMMCKPLFLGILIN